jgi:small-conductance mechanosensitive channel
MQRVVDKLDKIPVVELVSSAVILALAFGVTQIVKLSVGRVLKRHRAAGTLEPESATRLLMSRRIINAVVWIFGIAAALSQFPHLRVLSAGLIASAGISGIVVGFAARSTLGNAIAGITIAFSQPMRIGDDIEFRGERGIVEDITLLFTTLRLIDGKRLVIPNDTLQSEVIKNLTLGQAARIARPELIVAPVGDANAVAQSLRQLATSYDALDPSAAPPELYFVRIDERGTLLRLVATCRDQAAAEKLAQLALSRGAALAFHGHPSIE